MGQLSEIGGMDFTEIELQLNDNLIDFCQEIAQLDQHCFRVGTAPQPGIFPSLWALWDLNGNEKIEPSELIIGRKSMDLDNDYYNSWLEEAAFLMRN